MKKVCVIGSINYDLVTDVERYPIQGETMRGNGFWEFCGGKGANQAIAISKLDKEVNFFGKIGNDLYGKILIDNFKTNKVDTTNIETENTNSGIALITISDKNNRIIIIPGANEKVDIDYIKRREKQILEHDIVVCQLEIPIKTVEYIARICKENDKMFVLNPAPAQKLNMELINNCTYITPNESEIIVITEETDQDEVLKKFPNKVILTNGKNGIKYFDGNEMIQIDAIDVDAIDTTGAGDTFNGAFVYALSEGMILREAIEFANIAAGLSVTKKGAQSGMPNLSDVKEEGKKYKKEGN